MIWSWFKRLVRQPEPLIDPEMVKRLRGAMMSFDPEKMTELTSEILEKFADLAHREMLYDADSSRRRVILDMSVSELADTIYEDCTDPLWHEEQNPFPQELLGPMAVACKRYAEKQHPTGS